jgi:hypothetical protein
MPEPIVNPISGTLRELSRAEFLALFDSTVHEAIRAATELPGTDALVCMEVLQMDSSQCGHRTALAVGPGRTFKVSDLSTAGFRLGDVPSRFAYPVAIWRLLL